MSLVPEEPRITRWRVVPVADVLATVFAVPGDPAGRPRIVAIDAGRGDGKTALASVLAAAPPRSAVTHTDDLTWIHSFCGGAQALAEGVLDPLRRGEAVDYRPPAW